MDHMVAGLLEANRRYLPDGLPIVFDLQVESEVLGCDLMGSEDSPPSVSSHPLRLVDYHNSRLHPNCPKA